MFDAASPEPAPRTTGKPWSFAEAAAFLGISVKHLRSLAELGRVATITIGTRKRLIADVELRRIAREGVRHEG
jgi:hypothetical protein